VLTRWSRIPIWKQALLAVGVLYVLWVVSEFASGHGRQVFSSTSLIVLLLLLVWGAMAVTVLYPFKWLSSLDRLRWGRRKPKG
jgi:hypothetical protein